MANPQVTNAEVMKEFFGCSSPSQMKAAGRIPRCAYLELTEDARGIVEKPDEVVNPYGGKSP